MKKIFDTLRSVYFWEKANSAEEKKDFRKAKFYLDKLETAGALTIRARLALARVEMRLGNYESAINIALEAQAQIMRYNKRRYKEADKSYLYAYAFEIGRWSEMKIGVQDTALGNIEVSEVPLDMVAAHLKQQFPLKIHPEWK